MARARGVSRYAAAQAPGALALAELHLRALYVHDERGRIRARSRGDLAPAPRFHLVRTRLGNLWRFREDAAPALVRRLATLAAKERAWPGGDDRTPPERAEFVRRALEEDAKVASSAAGVVFAIEAEPRVRAVAAQIREIAPGDDLRAHAEVVAVLPTAGELAVGAFVDGELVALCRGARASAAAAVHAQLATAAELRGRGLASALLAAFAARARAAGFLPLLRAPDANAVARAVARKLALTAFADEWEWY